MTVILFSNFFWKCMHCKRSKVSVFSKSLSSQKPTKSKTSAIQTISLSCLRTLISSRLLTFANFTGRHIRWVQARLHIKLSTLCVNPKGCSFLWSGRRGWAWMCLKSQLTVIWFCSICKITPERWMGIWPRWVLRRLQDWKMIWTISFVKLTGTGTTGKYFTSKFRKWRCESWEQTVYWSGKAQHTLQTSCWGQTKFVRELCKFMGWFTRATAHSDCWTRRSKKSKKR